MSPKVFIFQKYLQWRDKFYQWSYDERVLHVWLLNIRSLLKLPFYTNNCNASYFLLKEGNSFHELLLNFHENFQYQFLFTSSIYNFLWTFLTCVFYWWCKRYCLLETKSVLETDGSSSVHFKYQSVHLDLLKNHLGKRHFFLSVDCLMSQKS